MMSRALFIGAMLAALSPACEQPGGGPICQTGTEGCLCIQPNLCVEGLSCVSGVCVAPPSGFPTSDLAYMDAEVSDQGEQADTGDDGRDGSARIDAIVASDAPAEPDTTPAPDVVAPPHDSGSSLSDSSGGGPDADWDAPAVPDTGGADADTCATSGGDDAGLPPGAVCEDQEMLVCGQTVSGETGLDGTWGEMNLYSCTNAYADNADEHVYGFAVDVSTNVTLTLTPTGGDDLNLWLLAGTCDPNNCIDYSHLYNPEVVNFVAVPGLDYHVVVDGWSFHTGPYTLQVECQSEF